MTLKNWLLLSPGHLSYWKQNQNCLKTSYIQVFGPVERRFDAFGRLHCQQPSLSTLWCPLSKGQYLFFGILQTYLSNLTPFDEIWDHSTSELYQTQFEVKKTTQESQESSENHEHTLDPMVLVVLAIVALVIILLVLVVCAVVAFRFGQRSNILSFLLISIF